jgi:PAS domain S-box-containing protein
VLLNMARSQTEFRQSEERYRNLADNLPDYIVVHDGKSILYTNPEATLLMEPFGDTLVGQPIPAFLTPEISLTGVASTSPALLSETAVKLQDNTVRHCMIKTVQIEDKGIPAFLSVITDITDRKTAEDALSQANKKLMILSSVTRHDIKNQLLALSGYLELSKETLDGFPVISEYLKKGMSITQTIESQIDFTKTCEDVGKTAPVWQNIHASVRRAVATLPMRDVRVDVDRSDLEIYADPLFEKVFYNLIDNALNYGGEAMTTIRIQSSETGAGLVIACADDGVGIMSGDKMRLFDQGYGKHTGLGLFLSREILSITGITIAETGEPGKGARFEMIVPNGAYLFTSKNLPAAGNNQKGIQ